MCTMTLHQTGHTNPPLLPYDHSSGMHPAWYRQAYQADAFVCGKGRKRPVSSEYAYFIVSSKTGGWLTRALWTSTTRCI